MYERENVKTFKNLSDHHRNTYYVLSSHIYTFVHSHFRTFKK